MKETEFYQRYLKIQCFKMIHFMETKQSIEVAVTSGVLTLNGLDAPKSLLKIQRIQSENSSSNLTLRIFIKAN